MYYPDDDQELGDNLALGNEAPVASAQNGSRPQYAQTPSFVGGPPAQNGARPQYARTPRVVGATPAYQQPPIPDAAPKLAERKPQPARPSAPAAPKRFAKLRELLGGKRSAKDAAFAFEDRPLPTAATSPEERERYLTAAARAGYDIKPNDLNDFVGRVSALGEAGVIKSELFLKSDGGQGALAELLMRQKPELVDHARFANHADFDRHEPFIRQYARDFNVTNVLADETRFNRMMDRVAEMAPLKPNDGFARFTEVREALREIGVRVTVNDFEQFKKELKREWTADLMRQNEKSLGTQALLDMTLPPDSRRLIGSGTVRWDAVLRDNQQFPELAARREELRQQAAEPKDPALANSFLPPAPPRPPWMFRDGVERPVPKGYSQDGKIVKIDVPRREVWQATRSSDAPGQDLAPVCYDLVDISRAIPLEDLETAMERGHNVNVSLKDGVYNVVDRDYVPRFELSDLDRAAANLENPEHLQALAAETEAVEIDQ